MSDAPLNTQLSILNSIKKMLAIDPSYDVFDDEIKMHINSVFSILEQIGATPAGGFYLETGNEKWTDYLHDIKGVDMVKSYIFLKVQLIFDPPPTSFAIESKQKLIAELESRLNYHELTFNPSARDFAPSVQGLPATAWVMNDDDTYPEGMKSGEVALNTVTGDLWRKP